MNIYNFLFFFIFLINTVISQSNNENECMTPSNEKGHCINIKSCPILEKLLVYHRKNILVRNFLRKSNCGYENKVPKVCCSLKKDSSNFNDDISLIIGHHKNHVGGNTTTIQTGIEDILLNPLTCGQSNVTHAKVTAGSVLASIGGWPWIVALGYHRTNVKTNHLTEWLCSGTLISNSYVITTARCVTNIDVSLHEVRLGDLNLDPKVPDEAETVTVHVATIAYHDQYDSKKRTDDIAIVKLKTPVHYSKYIQPICLPSSTTLKANSFDKTLQYVAGWGATILDGPKNNALTEAEVSVVSNEECKRIFANNLTIQEVHICAGNLKGAKHTCSRDAGGPLTWKKDNQYYLTGIQSFGDKCGESGFPAVYTRMTKYLNWIISKINYN
ncbi:venom protease-like [Daktulosphaira vitifoliae]|uniref:venom protease-like n=1 Tax=Daktulosphaira vitifoliae TaxID=58002 RepID=UPI0021AA38BD|nr:venom protease-like [Daktulosphaira vitifoliae]